MGYRSNVRIITTKKGFDELNKYVTQELQSKDKNNNYNLLYDTAIFEKTKRGYYFGWNWVKWYDGYTDVDAIMNGLEHLEKKDLSYRFARIGEDYGDYEELSYDSTMDKNRLNYPSVVRDFDDMYTIEDMNYEYSNEVEL